MVLEGSVLGCLAPRAWCWEPGKGWLFLADKRPIKGENKRSPLSGLGMDPGAVCMPGKCSTAVLHPGFHSSCLIPNDTWWPFWNVLPTTFPGHMQFSAHKHAQGHLPSSSWKFNCPFFPLVLIQGLAVRPRPALNLLCSPSWPWICDLPASASRVQGLQVRTSTPS